VSAGPLLLAALLAQGGAPRDPPADPRSLRVEVGEGGDAVVFRGDDPRPIRGAEIYRAVLRRDLLEDHERARTRRLFFFVGAVTGAVGGPALGYVLANATGGSLENCGSIPGPPEDCLAHNAEIARENASRRRRGLAIGAAAGGAAALGLAWAGLSVRPHVPGVEEARALVERYNTRLGPPARPDARLLLEPVRGGARVVLSVTR
jgi:hypothetical protein